MKKLLKEFGKGTAAMLISAALIMSIPVLNLIVHGDMFQDKVKTKTEVKVVKIAKKPPEQKKKRKLRKPKRSKPKSRNLKAGPRFAMDLGVAGMGGANVPSNLIGASGGGGGGAGGDVDERPKNDCPPNFELPAAIKESEEDAKVVVSFCVNELGEVYDLRVVEERPTGKGLADAASNAVRSSCFQPAMKDDKALSFCGMEQPFEVKWND